MKWKTFLDWKLKNPSRVRGWKVRIVLPTYSPPSQKTADSYRPNRQSEEFWKSDSTSNLLPSLSKNSWLYRPNRQLLHQEISWYHAVHAGYISRDCTKKSAEIFYNPWVQKEAKHSKSAKVKKEAKITRLGQIGYRKSQMLPEDKYHPKRHLSTQKPNLSWIRTGVDKKPNLSWIRTGVDKKTQWNPCDRSCHKSSKTLWQKLSQIFKHLSSKNLSWIRTGVDKKPTLYHAWLQGPTEHATSRGHKICSAAENPPCFRQKEVTRSTEWAHSLKQTSPRQNPGRPDSA